MRLLQRTLEVISLVRYKNDFIPCSSLKIEGIALIMGQLYH